MSRTLPSIGAIALCVLFCVSQKLSAQGSNAAIVGSCFDSSGAAVPNATVEAREVDTNLKSESKTNAAGYYVFPSLPVGTYEVTFTAVGFKSEVRTGVILRVGDRTRLDFTAEVGGIQQKVEVQSEAPLAPYHGVAIEQPERARANAAHARGEERDGRHQSRFRAIPELSDGEHWRERFSRHFQFFLARWRRQQCSRIQ